MTGDLTTCSGCAWERAQSLSDAAQLMSAWLLGEYVEHPGHSAPPDEETYTIREPLLTLAACGVVPVGSQPGTGEAPEGAPGHPEYDEDAPARPRYAARPPAGTALQRAYLELIGPPEPLTHIAQALRSAPVQAAQWATRTRPATKYPSLDMAVTVVALDIAPPATDPYLEANLLTYLNPSPYSRYLPAGMYTTDGSIDLADREGLDPRVWAPTTRATSDWALSDVLAKLELSLPDDGHLPPGQILATADLTCALNGSASLLLVDRHWGRTDWLAHTAADAAASWHMRRSGRHHL